MENIYLMEQLISTQFFQERTHSTTCIEKKGDGRMIEKIRRAIDSGKYETDIYLQFTKFQQQEDCLTLTCSIYIEEDEKGKLVDQWLIECLDFEEYRIESFISYEQEEFEFTDDHPYLWDYQKSFTELYFRGEAVHVKALIGALYLKHHSLTGNLIPFDQYLNTHIGNDDLDWLLSRSQGLFSTAPEILSEAYQELLVEYGFSTSQLLHKETPVNSDFHLLRLGPSYVIAKEFKVVRVNIEKWLL